MHSKRLKFFSFILFFLCTALGVDEEMDVDVTQLAAPQTFVNGVGKLAFVIDPFNKTNDVNRTNNVLFATINLQRDGSGELSSRTPKTKGGIIQLIIS